MMAGKIPHLLDRDGRYFARITVPPELRSVIGRRELRSPLGPDLKSAKAKLHSAMAEHYAKLDGARALLSRAKPASLRPATTAQLVRRHYGEELNLDARARLNRTTAHTDPDLFRQDWLNALRHVVYGNPSNGEIAAT